MKRRDFVTKLVIGLSATAIAAKIPANIVFATVPKPYLQGSVQAYLTKMWNDWCRSSGTYPRYIEMGQDIFVALEGELQTLQRFVDLKEITCGYKTLCFKSSRVRAMGRGWDVKMYAEAPAGDYGQRWERAMEAGS